MFDIQLKLKQFHLM